MRYNRVLVCSSKPLLGLNSFHTFFRNHIPQSGGAMDDGTTLLPFDWCVRNLSAVVQNAQRMSSSICRNPCRVLRTPAAWLLW